MFDPNWYPKNKIMVNEKTQVGDVDTKKYIEKMENIEAFEPTYVDTAGDETFKGFHNRTLDYSINNASDFPWSYGSYQFFEMDEEKHQYKILSYVNVTSPYSALLYPQFIVESVLRNALDDDEFELKFRTTPFPAPHETVSKGSFLTSKDNSLIGIILTLSDEVGFWGRVSVEVSGTLCFSWIIVNIVILLSVMRDRTSYRKHYQEHHGQSKLAYWLARFFHDIIFYIPISFIAIVLI